MKKLEHYIINYKTCLLIPKFDDDGQIISKVVEENNLHFVTMSPKELIDYSLRRYGSSLRGAIEGTTSLLGPMRMHPIKISLNHNLFWFPHKSVDKDDCIWFSLKDILVFNDTDQTTTEVVLKNGERLKLDIKRQQFERQVQRAQMLKYQLEQVSQKFNKENVTHNSTLFI